MNRKCFQRQFAAAVRHTSPRFGGKAALHDIALDRPPKKGVAWGRGVVRYGVTDRKEAAIPWLHKTR